MKEPCQYQMEQILHSAVRNITPYRKNWLIETEAGKWVVKRTRFPARLRWWLKVDQELRLRGFTAMPPIRSDGSRWIITPFIEGKTASYSRWQEVEKILQVLAQFHLVGQRLHTPPEKGAAFLLYHRLYERLIQFYRVLTKTPFLEKELGELLESHGQDFYLDGRRAWQRLQSLPLQKICHDEWFVRNITHRDLASHNWMIDEGGNPWLIDFETASYDSQLGDIWQISARILSENNWTDEWCHRVLMSYEYVRPLSPLEKKILYTLFSYPNEFFREAIGLAERKRGYEIKHSVPYLKKLIEQRENWQKQIKRISYW
ncbi:phosphotransferase [Lihuaxuella thermophila]|uniref:Spore coat protein, CotS family n=1 Tax=Lihuaxuella thermophila TaxID=1173111 RepID=A0A1H8FTL1_9BACL|nr:phosphotransferase [Lihuaxuella thermophila]SEN34880.1 spore coat protein, CotS family [Lihuaxuella thermophila]